MRTSSRQLRALSTASREALGAAVHSRVRSAQTPTHPIGARAVPLVATNSARSSVAAAGAPMSAPAHAMPQATNIPFKAVVIEAPVPEGHVSHKQFAFGLSIEMI